MTDEQENKTSALISLLRDANRFEIGVVAFLILPAVLFAWISILKEIVPGEDQKTARLLVYIALVLVYFIVVGVMLCGKNNVERLKNEEAKKQAEAEEEKKRTESAKDAIYTNLVAKGFKRASFDKLRRILNHDASWNDEFLSKVVESYPDLFCHVTIKGGLRGLRLLETNDDGADQEEAV